MDIWEANARGTSIAPHPCKNPGLYLCEGEECEFDGVCDKWGKFFTEAPSTKIEENGGFPTMF